MGCAAVGVGGLTRGGVGALTGAAAGLVVVVVVVVVLLMRPRLPKKKDNKGLLEGICEGRV